jgi:3-oxoacyl-[acyl-carrier-protein] synthase-1
LGATGVQEAIYSILMMKNNFIAASANVENIDPDLNADEIATVRQDQVNIDTILSNSFGFGGTNATIAMSKYNG